MSSTQQDYPREQKVEGKAVAVTVFGMSCPLCANNVDKQLLNVPGVTHVLPHLKTGRVLVTIDPANPPTYGDLIDAVVNSGFTLKGIDKP